MVSESGSKRIQRLLIEFTVIVVGVFVAVAAESWWSEREDRRFEQELRDDMMAEFVQNIRILESDLNENAIASTYFSELAEMDDTTLLSLSDAELTATYGGFPDWAGFDPEMGAAQALVQSGNLGILSDPELRILMSRWAGLLTASKRFVLQASNFQIQELMVTIAAVTADLRWTPAERRQVQSLFETISLLQSLVVRNQKQLLTTAQELLQYLESTR